MKEIIEIFKSLLEPVSIIFIVAILLIINSWFFKRLKNVQSEGNIIKRTISFLVVLTGILTFILAIPIDKTLKGQVISFLAVIISAAIALSSTTVLGNLIAGIMNNTMDRFRSGDLIKIGDFQGRVTKKSIFHTEIQLEDSNFVTIPNLFIASNPVKLTRKSKTVVSTSVSLGYDVPRSEIEAALTEAAISIGLTDPYVYIMNLGDYSVVYKIHGGLKDSNKYFSTSSLLNSKVIDMLHKRRIEIVSPTFMNQRRVDDKDFIPAAEASDKIHRSETSPEDLIFDEAIRSEEIEKKKESLKKLIKKQDDLKDKLKDLKIEDEIEKTKSLIERIDDLKQRIETDIKANSKRNK